MIIDRDSENIATKASKAYKIYKEWYTVSEQELDRIEKITGIDIYPLRLKKILEKSLQEEGDKEKRVALYKNAMQEEISRRKDKNLPYTELENQLNSFNPNIMVDNLYDTLLSGYIKEINNKIGYSFELKYKEKPKNLEQNKAYLFLEEAKIKIAFIDANNESQIITLLKNDLKNWDEINNILQDNEKKKQLEPNHITAIFSITSKNGCTKKTENNTYFSFSKNNTEDLQAVKEFLQYHRTLRKDLINPSERLLNTKHAPEEKELKKVFLSHCTSNFFNNNKKLKELSEINQIKTETAYKFIKNVKFSNVNVIVDEIERGTPLITDFTNENNQLGYIKFDLFKTEQLNLNSFVENLHLPKELKDYIEVINSYIDLVQDLQHICGSLSQIEKGAILKVALNQFKLNLENNINIVKEKIKNVNIPEKFKNDVDLLLKKLSNENWLNTKDIKEAIKFILQLTPDDILEKPICLKGNNLSTNSLENLATEAKTITGHLGKLDVKRVIYNAAMLDARFFARDNVANDLNNAVNFIFKKELKQLENNNDFQEFKNTKILLKDKSYQEILKHFNSIKELLNNNLFNVAALFDAYLKCSKDISKSSNMSLTNNSYPLQQMGKAITAIQQYSKALAPAIYTQQEYLTVLQKRLEHSYKGYLNSKNTKVYPEFFSGLIDLLEPKRDNKDDRDIEERFTDYMKRTKLQLSTLGNILHKMAETKHAMKYLGGQLSYKCEGDDFDYKSSFNL